MVVVFGQKMHLQVYAVSISLYQLLPNIAFQLTRCASLALQDRWHFDTITNLSMLYTRSEQLNSTVRRSH
jgi:hypothetical protein